MLLTLSNLLSCHVVNIDVSDFRKISSNVYCVGHCWKQNATENEVDIKEGTGFSNQLNFVFKKVKLYKKRQTTQDKEVITIILDIFEAKKL